MAKIEKTTSASKNSVEDQTNEQVLMPVPYLLFLGDCQIEEAAKTAFGLVQWRRELCIGQLRLSDCKIDVGLSDVTIQQATSMGAKSLVIGVVNAGGFISDEWVSYFVEALDAGLDLVSGMHQSLSDIPALKEAARRNGQKLIDIRSNTRNFETGTGRKRSGKRVLTVGPDCAIGKKYSALSIEQSLRDLGVKADFRATGQTGVMIAGRGIAIDAIVSDFMAGAAEWLSPDNDPDHWDVIEGQGSLFHPAYAGVSVGLMHGSQPDALVICHQPGRKNIISVENYELPSLRDCIELNMAMAKLTNPAVKTVGVCANTSKLSAQEAEVAIRAIEDEVGLPCCDPVREGTEKIAKYMLEIYN
ncbi:N-acetyltransferase DgcN [Hyphococcus lacteus]|uniref:N-acetyltransferase DgcN n=1 Tax=Hyphococcus lacteus TaxID=3143536 RepID=A0ABV3Z6V7_9PROT